MINEFWTKWQLWPKNVITQILQSLYNFISTLVPNNYIVKQRYLQGINGITLKTDFGESYIAQLEFVFELIGENSLTILN